MKRQNNLEIFVDCDLATLDAWLGRVAGPVTPGPELGDMLSRETRIGMVCVTPNMGNSSFCSLYFDNSHSPWDTDVDCAREAATALGCAVRCDPGEHHPEVPWWASDCFLEIKNGEEKIIRWQDEPADD